MKKKKNDDSRKKIEAFWIVEIKHYLFEVRTSKENLYDTHGCNGNNDEMRVRILLDYKKEKEKATTVIHRPGISQNIIWSNKSLDRRLDGTCTLVLYIGCINEFVIHCINWRVWKIFHVEKWSIMVWCETKKQNKKIRYHLSHRSVYSLHSSVLYLNTIGKTLTGTRRQGSRHWFLTQLNLLFVANEAGNLKYNQINSLNHLKN